ncbi:MAG: hypothetical protein V3U35_03825 [Candidatus Neomarinimicrobiota bacterium]
MNRPIFLLGAHKSGTSLLRSLFDGHPDLFAVPVEAHFFQLTGSWINYSLRKSPPSPVSRSQFASNGKEWIRSCNEAEPRYSDSFAKGRFDLQRFDQALEARLPDRPSPVWNDKTFACSW